MAILLLSIGHVLAADYHVYCSATNAVPGDGTPANPWQKLSGIQWGALQSMANGGTNVFVNLQRGSTWRENLIIGGSGTPAFPITIQTYGTGPKPRIDGGEALTNWNAFASPTGSIWSCSTPLASAVVAVFRNRDVLVKGGTPATLQDRQWCISAGTLCLRDDSGQPDTNGVSVFGLVRDRPIDCRTQHDLGMTDVEIWGGSSTGMYFDQATNISVLRCRVEKSYQSAQIQRSSNVTFTATRFGQSVGSGIYSTKSNAALRFLFCVMSPGPSGSPSLNVDNASSSIDLINCTLVGSRQGHILNSGSNIIRLDNCILSVPTSSDRKISGRTIYNTGGKVTANYCLVQPNGQWPDHMVDGANLGPGCLFTSPGFVKNASRGFFCLGLDDSGSFSSFTNLVRLADARGLKTYFALDGVNNWVPMRSSLQSAIWNGHDILCHTMGHSSLTESNAITIQYAGTGSNATVAVSNGFLTTAVDGTNSSSITLGSTISALAAELNRQPGFSASSPKEANVLSANLANLPETSVMSPIMLKWDMPSKWANEVGAWGVKASNTFVKADGTPYYSPYIVYPSGFRNEAAIAMLQEFGFKGGRTVNIAAKRLQEFDMFDVAIGPEFRGRGAQLRFELNLQDQGGNSFTGVNVSYSPVAFEGSYSGLFNGTNAFAWATNGSVWDFSLGDWHVAVAAKLAGTEREQTIFSQGADAGNNMRVVIAMDGGVFVSVNAGGVEQLRLGTPPGLVPADGRWHRIKVRETFDLWRIYIDGVVWAETSSAVRCKPYGGDVLIGCETAWGTGTQTNYFSGQLDNFSNSQRTYMNTQALMDTAGEAGFIYMAYSHGDFISSDTYEIVLDAVAEYPGGSASMMAPSAAFEEIFANSMVVSNRWVTLTNVGSPNYRLSSASRARDSGDPSVLIGRPNLEDMDGLQVTDSSGNLLPATASVSLGAYQQRWAGVSLSHAYTNDSLTLTWPEDQGYWKLYTSTNLTSFGPWLPVSKPPVRLDAGWSVTVPTMAQGQRFYRLQ